MRVFIAIDMPGDVKKYLKEIQKQLGNAKLKLVDEFHLTLKFLGEVPENKVKEIESLLKEIKFEKFKTKLTNIGVFPSESYVRVVWVGLEDYDIKIIQRNIDDKLQNMFPRNKKFSAHVTLARVKFVDDKKKFIENMKNIEIEKKEFEVSEFKLKKSTLTKQGPIYEDLEVFKPQSL